MTFREAVIEAHARLGNDVESIKKALAAADAMFPEAVKASKKTIPKEIESALIDELVTNFRSMQEDLDAQNNVADALEQHIKNKSRLN